MYKQKSREMLLTPAIRVLSFCFRGGAVCYHTAPKPTKIKHIWNLNL